MTPDTRQLAFENLITALWQGTLSEREFGIRALELGISLSAINHELQALREEDNVGC